MDYNKLGRMEKVGEMDVYVTGQGAAAIVIVNDIFGHEFNQVKFRVLPLARLNVAYLLGTRFWSRVTTRRMLVHSGKHVILDVLYFYSVCHQQSIKGAQVV